MNDKAQITPEIVKYIRGIFWKSPSEAKDRLEIYSAVNLVNAHLNLGNVRNYKVLDFYRPNSFMSALEEVEAEGYSEKLIKPKLLTHKRATLDFANYVKGWGMEVQRTNDLPENDIKAMVDEFGKFFVVDERQLDASGEKQRGLRTNKPKELLRQIRSHPIRRVYSLKPPIGANPSQKRNIFILATTKYFVGATDEELKKAIILLEKCGVKIETSLANNPPTEAGAVISLISKALGIQLGKQLGETLTPVNIHPNYRGNMYPKPPADAYIQDMERIDKDNKKTIFVRTTQRDVKQNNALLASVNPDDPTLFDLLPTKYKDPTEIFGLLQRTTLRANIALSSYLLKNPNPPEDIKLKDLAKYYGYYAEQIKKRGYFDKSLSEDFANQLALAMIYKSPYSRYDEKTKSEKVGAVSLFDFEMSKDKKTISGLRWSREFLELCNGKGAMLFLSIPKGFDDLNMWEQEVALKISQRFVTNRQMTKTIRREPITIKVSDLWRGVLSEPPKGNRRKRYEKKETIFKYLDNIQSKTDLIAYYEKIGTAQVRVYPSEATSKSYKDPQLGRALADKQKASKRNKRNDLERLLEHYRKTDGLGEQAVESLAEDLGLEVDELTRMLMKDTKKTKAVEIPEDLYKEILDNLEYYEK